MISVLYTDDEPGLLEIGKIYLEMSGEFTITTATCADEALRLLEKEIFDAVVSDYQMPGMDGIEFLLEVRKKYGDLPFILFTGRGREEVVIQAINSGADFYIQKGGEPKSQFAELSHKIKSAVSKRKAEESLRKSEEQSRNLLSAMPDVVLVHREGVIIYANQMATLMSGHSYEQLVGSELLDFIPPEYHETVIKRMKMRNSGVNIDDYEIQLKEKSGSLHHVMVRTAPIIFNGLPSTIVILTNITERKRMETALRESENLYRTLFENTGTGTIIIENDTIISKANRVYAELVGLPIDEIEGKISWTSFVSPEDKEIMLKYHRLRRSEHPESAEQVYKFRSLNSRGEMRDLICYVGMIPQTNKSVASIIDITELKKTENELKKSHEELIASYEQLKAAEEELKAQYAVLEENEVVIRVNEERFIMAEEIGHIGCWEYNLNSGKIWASAEALRIFGMPHTEEEISTKEVELCILKPEIHRKAIYDLISYGKNYDIELYIQPADDSPIRYIHSVGRMIKDRNNTPIKILGIIQDITEQKNANEALKLKNYTVESSRDGIGIADLSGVMTYVNPAFISIMGYENAEELIGLSYQNFPFDNEEGKDIFNELMEKGTWSGEVMGRKKDGNSVPLKFNINLIHNSEGIPISMMCSFSDITQNKLAEEKLIKSENRYRSIFDNANDQIIIHEMKPNHRPGRITEANQRALDTLGYSRDELLNMTIGDISLPHSVEEEKGIENLLLNMRRAIFPANQFTKDGRKIPVEVSTNYYEYGDNTECVSVVRDLSERIAAQETLSRAHNQLKLISGITRHDIYNQVTIMIGYLAMMKSGIKTGLSQEDYIDKLDTITRRINTIITKTKDYGDIGVNEPVWQNCHISADKAVVELSPENIIIINEIPSEIEVLADPSFFRVFYNLIENSQRHGGDITKVEFSGEVSGDDYLIVYSDDGKGIPTTEKENIYDKNYGQNTGLGLFFSKEILAITGISISENGVYGEGVRFEIKIPKESWQISAPEN